MRFEGFSLAALASLVGTVSLAAAEVRFYEQGGVTYRETREVVRRPIVETRLETQPRTVYVEQTRVDAPSQPQQAWVAVRSWEPQTVWRQPLFCWRPPYQATSWRMTTRYEPRVVGYSQPLVRREWVPQTVEVQVPVPTQRFVEEEVIQRVAVSVRPNTTVGPPTAVASAPGTTTAVVPVAPPAPVGPLTPPGAYRPAPIANAAAASGPVVYQTAPPPGSVSPVYGAPPMHAAQPPAYAAQPPAYAPPVYTARQPVYGGWQTPWGFPPRQAGLYPPAPAWPTYQR